MQQEVQSLSYYVIVLCAVRETILELFDLYTARVTILEIMRYSTLWSKRNNRRAIFYVIRKQQEENSQTISQQEEGSLRYYVVTQ